MDLGCVITDVYDPELFKESPRVDINVTQDDSSFRDVGIQVNLDETKINTIEICPLEKLSQIIETRRSENDDTPQPLGQWTNSPFMGQQVGNWSICHALWPKRKPIVHPTLYTTHIYIIQSQSTFAFLKYGY